MDNLELLVHEGLELSRPVAIRVQRGDEMRAQRGEEVQLVGVGFAKMVNSGVGLVNRWLLWRIDRVPIPNSGVVSTVIAEHVQGLHVLVNEIVIVDLEALSNLLGITLAHQFKETRQASEGHDFASQPR